MKAIVAGIGPGNPLYFTQDVKNAITDADIVLSSQSRLEYVKELNENTVYMGVLDTIKYINENSEKKGTICVAASGDTGFYSIANTVRTRILPEIETEFLCGIGSLSYFMSKLRIGYENVRLVSLHGNEKSIVPYVCYNEKVFSLTGGKVKASDVVTELLNAGFGDEVQISVGENLSFENERILTGTLKELKNVDFSDLCVVYIHNSNYVDRYKILKDDDFIRGKSPMTKEAVRNLCTSALEIRPEDVVYDIGAGTGAMTCAMALKASESKVYALEKNDFAVELVKENMEKTGIRNIVIKEALAPEGLSEFPPCDKVFIGGSSGNAGEIVDECLKKNPKAVIVITAVTLETISEAFNIFNERNMNFEVICANISCGQKLGRYNLMKAENPVYIVKGCVKNEEESA